MSKLPEDRVRIPVKLVDGRWEFFYGGDVPISEGTVGELVVGKAHVTNGEFIARLKKKTSYKVMGKGTRLMVALNIKNKPALGSGLVAHLKKLPIEKISRDKKFARFGVNENTRFVEIMVGDGGNNKSLFGSEDSGIWLELEGMEPQGVSVSSLILPEGITDQKIDSLNYAFTLLSEKYEPWRMAHTGSIYERIFYEEENGVWCPLNVLRNAAIATEEQNLIRQRWQDIRAQLNLNF